MIKFFNAEDSTILITDKKLPDDIISEVMEITDNLLIMPTKSYIMDILKDKFDSNHFYYFFNIEKITIKLMWILNHGASFVSPRKMSFDPIDRLYK